MKRLFSLIAGSLVALLMAGTGARADNIFWNYDWAASPVTVNGSPLGGVFFTNEPGLNALNSSDVVATNLYVLGLDSEDAPTTVIDPAGGTYKLTLNLRTGKSGDTGQLAGTLEFDGRLGGQFSFLNTNITNAFEGETTKELVLGDTKFTVTIGPYSPPGLLNSGLRGSIAAHVDVRAVDDNGGVNKVPEPSTMALSALGLSVLGFTGWRKRRALAATPA